MKILIKRKDTIVRVYHEPRNVIVKPKAKQVDVFDSDGTLLETFELIDKELSWIDDPEGDTSEIVLKLTIGNSLGGTNGVHP